MLYIEKLEREMISDILCTRYEQNIIRYSHTFSSGQQLTWANVYQDFLIETLQHKVQAFLEETFHDSKPFDRDHLDIAANVLLQLQCVDM